MWIFFIKKEVKSNHKFSDLFLITSYFSLFRSVYINTSWIFFSHLRYLLRHSFLLILFLFCIYVSSFEDNILSFPEKNVLNLLSEISFKFFYEPSSHLKMKLIYFIFLSPFLRLHSLNTYKYTLFLTDPYTSVIYLVFSFITLS